MRFNRLVRALGILALMASTTLSATTYTHAQAHSLNVGSDTHKMTLWTGANGSGTNIGSKVLSGTAIATYYSAGCTCYEVPLSIFNYVSGYSAADAVSARQQHLSPNLPSGQESMIEILD